MGVGCVDARSRAGGAVRFEVCRVELFVRIWSYLLRYLDLDLVGRVKGVRGARN